MSLQVIDPATGQPTTTFEALSDRQAAQAVEAAHRAFRDWRSTGFDERAARLREAAEVLERRAGKYAALMAREMGKPLADGRSEVEKCAWICEHYADNGAEMLAPEPASPRRRDSRRAGILLSTDRAHRRDLGHAGL